MRFVKWVLLAVVRPVLTFWILINGIPPTIRAIASAIATVAKALK